MSLPAIGSVCSAQLERGVRSVRVLGLQRCRFSKRLPRAARQHAACYYLARVHVLGDDVEQVIAVERLVA